MKLSILTPSLNRPESLKKFLDSVVATATQPENIEILIGMEESDVATKCVYDEYSNKYKSLTWGAMCFNNGAPLNAKFNKLAEHANGDLMLAGSDDIEFMTDAWDVAIFNAFNEHKDRGLLVWVNDGPGAENLPRHYCISRESYTMLGWFIQKDMMHYFGDNVMMDIFANLQRVKYLEEVKVLHKHPVFGTGEQDETHKKDMPYFNQDQAQYMKFRNQAGYYISRLAAYIHNFDKDPNPVNYKVNETLVFGEKHKNAKILVGTPAYGGMVHIDYCKTLIEMVGLGLNFVFYGIGNESLITRGRNTVFAYFMANPDFTHLLFLDADMYVKAEDIVKMLNHDKDVIGALVRLKSKTKIFNTSGVLSTHGDLLNLKTLGTAVFMLNRKAGEALRDKAIEDGRVYDTRSTIKREGDPEMTFYDVFRTGIKDKIYQSEDYWACYELKELGFEIWADGTINTRHNGVVGFEGME